MRSYDLAPRPLTSSLPSEGAGEEPNYTTARKPGPLSVIQYSLTHGKDLHFLLMIRVNTSSAENKFIS
jgi:hypothetical protein